MFQANERARTMWRDSLDKIRSHKRNTALGRDRMLTGELPFDTSSIFKLIYKLALAKYSNYEIFGLSYS